MLSSFRTFWTIAVCFVSQPLSIVARSATHTERARNLGAASCPPHSWSPISMVLPERSCAWINLCAPHRNIGSSDVLGAGQSIRSWRPVVLHRVRKDASQLQECRLIQRAFEYQLVPLN